jgi:hypothetical protein
MIDVETAAAPIPPPGPERGCHDPNHASYFAPTLDGADEVKKLVTTICLIAVAGCHSSAPATGPAPATPVINGNQTGAPDPIAAVRGFMEAVKQQDVQAMGALWGTSSGAARDLMEREYREKRELIMICYLKHDRYDIVGDAPNPGGTRAYAVNLSLGTLTRATSFKVVQGPSGRWYVEDVDLKPLQEFCARRS